MTSSNKISIDKKSKGGRQRQFSNEQRKDRNRQAQAAFRERRSKHTKALEDTITDLRTMVQILQQNVMQTKERAEKAEKRCEFLENDCQHLKTTLACLMPQFSPPASCKPTRLLTQEIALTLLFLV
jgi:chromosome segregation ATPase